MILWMFLKVFADSCLCFCFIGTFQQIFAPGFSLLWPALLCGAGAALAAVQMEQGRYGLRFVGILLPLTGFLLARSQVDILIMLPTAIYTAILIWKGDFALEYYTFRDQYKRVLTVWFFFFFAVCGLSYVESFSWAPGMTLSWENCLWYAICYAVSGVVLLRQLRLGDEGSRAMDNRQLLLVSAGTGTAVLGAVLLERWLAEKGSSVLRLIWDFFLMLLGLPFVLLGKLFTGFVSLLPEETVQKMESPLGESSQAGEALPQMPTEEMVEEAVQQVQRNEYPWWLAIAIVVVLAVILIVMLGIHRKNTPAGAGGFTVTDVETEKKEKKAANRSNRAKVRRYYREFLRSERMKGTKLTTSQTSADILQGIAQSTDRESAQKLREIYLRARYDEGWEVTSEEMTEAKTAMKNSRG